MEAHVEKSKQIAGLAGPVLIALSLSEALNLGIWTSLPVQTLAPTIYLNGTILFVAGLAIVRAHNRWTAGWPVLVTLVGWIVMLGGLFRMFVPSSGQLPNQNPLAEYAVFAVIFVVGAVLTFKAYQRVNG
jgi:uncharacterized membrane protein YhaH (DUF805 family)